jgi:hypothetical protein
MLEKVTRISVDVWKNHHRRYFDGGANHEQEAGIVGLLT